MQIRQQIAQRINDYDQAHDQLFIEVADSGQLDEVLRNRSTTEACYVIKLETQAQSQSEYYQAVTERYQIITICSNYTDSYGAAVGERAEAMQDTVFNAISGFICTKKGDTTDPLKFVTGGLVDLKDSLHVWADIYELGYTQQINQQ
ncbi:hypothetical protein [Psychrobacter sp. FDAARGOS_221]|uniref:phage tail terminator protein n=1 Tax=Psychrobacter sp. FDAARGOS_221 TaxID=1975705 RepID=UPI000BB571AD|nr:hypothetical protein [Psychrobacter sp. FDAARGOS_221]PNK59464.1 hypothetical protein A6J60_000215 [Psychrobacter sp. FDAARGOS_221]PNK59920.1 hypothetical protein A6J60_002845 [Psychrobacter sp. FDAARGOS_221]PNK61467.1 hypothetical protein A6J60_011730 [Psychrobacter sp. FDAARGOS_221]